MEEIRRGIKLNIKTWKLFNVDLALGYLLLHGALPRTRVCKRI